MVTNCDSDSALLVLEGGEEEEVPIPPQQIQFSMWNTFKHRLPRLAITVLVDVFLPFAVYIILRQLVKPVPALLLAGIPPLLMVITKAIVSRTFDALGFLAFIGFLISAIIAVVTDNPIILLLEKSLINGLMSIIFAITLIPFSCCHSRCHIRPLAYYFYQDLLQTKRIHVGLPDILFEDQQESIELQENGLIQKLTHKQEVAQVYEWIYAHCPSFRHACYTITSIWSVGLFIEFLGRLFLIIINLSPDKIYIYGHIILFVVTNVLFILTIICIKKERKRTFQSIEKWKKVHLYNRSDVPILSIII